MTLAFAQIFHLGNARRAKPVVHPRYAFANVSAILGAALALGLQVAAALVEPLASILRVAPLGRQEWFIVLALGLVPAVVGQALKRVRPHL